MTFIDAAGKRWRVIHTDRLRDVHTVVRARRFFAGSPRVVTGELIYALRHHTTAGALLRVRARREGLA